MQVADVPLLVAVQGTIILLGRMLYLEATPPTASGPTQTTHSMPQATQSPETSYREPLRPAPIRCTFPRRHRPPPPATTRQQFRPCGHCRSVTRVRPPHRVPTTPACGHSQQQHAVPRQAPVPRLVHDHRPTYTRRHMKATVTA